LYLSVSAPRINRLLQQVSTATDRFHCVPFRVGVMLVVWHRGKRREEVEEEEEEEEESRGRKEERQGEGKKLCVYWILTNL